MLLDDILEVTLDTLLVLLREQVGPMWREFGEAIDIDDVVLDSIMKSTFANDCIVEVLDYWLKYNDQKPTWNDVAEALHDIGLKKLALDIETGKE
ncbi:MAG: hypothetical protein MJE68_17630 [Proteobacteria bacterium]|nr:hypothetical protein [Pseudomonadota bacterium]